MEKETVSGSRGYSIWNQLCNGWRQLKIMSVHGNHIPSVVSLLNFNGQHMNHSLTCCFTFKWRKEDVKITSGYQDVYLLWLKVGNKKYFIQYFLSRFIQNVQPTGVL